MHITGQRREIIPQHLRRVDREHPLAPLGPVEEGSPIHFLHGAAHVQTVAGQRGVLHRICRGWDNRVKMEFGSGRAARNTLACQELVLTKPSRSAFLEIGRAAPHIVVQYGHFRYRARHQGQALQGAVTKLLLDNPFVISLGVLFARLGLQRWVDRKKSTVKKNINFCENTATNKRVVGII